MAALTAGQYEIGGRQDDEGEGLQQTEVDQIGEEPHAHHETRKVFEEVEADQHGRGELEERTGVAWCKHGCAESRTAGSCADRNPATIKVIFSVL